MQSFVLVIVGIAVGVAAALLLAPVASGVGADAGIVTGDETGACLTVEAAKEKGLLTDDQVDAVLRAACQQIASSGKVDDKASVAPLVQSLPKLAGCAGSPRTPVIFLASASINAPHPAAQ